MITDDVNGVSLILCDYSFQFYANNWNAFYFENIEIFK